MTHLVFINSFDRSGSSAIVNALKTVPHFTIFMQPFNSSGVRKKMYAIWDDSTPDEADKRCFESLAKFEMPIDYFASSWHEKFSSSQSFVPGNVHVLKTTINHFLVPWTKTKYPNILQYAIWRDPLDILASIIRNNVYEKSYAGAVAEILPAIESNNFLRKCFIRYVQFLDSDNKKAAFLIAVRNSFLLSHVDADKLIDYELFKTSPSKALSYFVNQFSDAEIDIDFVRNQDLSVWGHPYSPGESHRQLIDNSTLEFCQDVFHTLYSMRAKFS